MRIKEESRCFFIDKREVTYWEGGYTYTVFGIEFNFGGGVQKARIVETPMELITISWGFTQAADE